MGVLEKPSFYINRKHALVEGGWKGVYVHAMAMTKTTREGDVEPGNSSVNGA